MGQSEGLPVVVARGARYSKDEKASIKNLLNRYEDYGWVNNPRA
jgi:F420-0:gamma-glutamyl ligase